MARIFVGVVLALALYVGAFLFVNHSVAADPRDVVRAEVENLPGAGDALSLITWNIGYGGLGEESDFAVDGGEHYFPPSREIVEKNAAGIASFLRGQDADVFLIEELARGGLINYQVNVKGGVDEALAGRDHLFFADFQTRLMPWPLRMVHGQGIYSRFGVGEADVVSLPAENDGIFGVRRRYAAVVARLPIEGREHGWTIVSTHLAAFDDNATVRTQQLRELLAWAQQEHAAGQHVVIGGDFNLQLRETNFPSTTEERFLFWIHPFPPDALPQGWQIAADGSVPSVRTNERPYHAGENHTTTIDGFIVSPNVAIEEVRGINLNFAHSDHNPVFVRVRASGAN